MLAPNDAPGRRPRIAAAAGRVAFVAFALYLVLLLGGNSAAEFGGPPAWLPLWQLPAAGDQWVGIGLVSLLPPLSVAAWLLARWAAGSLRAIRWHGGWATWPLLALAVLALARAVVPCFGGDSQTTALLRLALLLIHLAWVTLYVVNERPPLFWVVVTVILLQSAVALGQFVTQSDLGLRFLGELPLDPQVPGVSVVMRGPVRWLRGYGLTPHPNVLAGTLTTLLLMLPALRPPATPARRWALVVAYGVGSAALFSTLARWAVFCFAMGLGINALPWLRRVLRRRGWRPLPFDGRALAALALAVTVMTVLYGDAVIGRAVGLETPIESRSLWERERDTQIALRLLGERPLTGVGLGRYVAEAQRYDRWAERVHNTPLLWGAELGAGAILLWLLLVIGPVWRREAFGRFAPETALWLGFWLLGLFYDRPDPLYELRYTLLTGLVVGLMAQTGKDEG